MGLLSQGMDALSISKSGAKPKSRRQSLQSAPASEGGGDVDGSDADTSTLDKDEGNILMALISQCKLAFPAVGDASSVMPYESSTQCRRPSTGVPQGLPLGLNGAPMRSLAPFHALVCAGPLRTAPVAWHDTKRRHRVDRGRRWLHFGHADRVGTLHVVPSVLDTASGGSVTGRAGPKSRSRRSRSARTRSPASSFAPSPTRVWSSMHVGLAHMAGEYASQLANLCRRQDVSERTLRGICGDARSGSPRVWLPFPPRLRPLS